MKEIKNTKKSKIIKGVALLGLFLLVFGVSYALFTVVLNGTKRNRITTGNLSLQLLNEEGNTLDENTIGLENALPMTDAEGKALTPYTFVLKNNGTIDAEYSLTLKDLDLAAGEERLNDKYVKISVTRGNYSYASEDLGTYILAHAKDRIIDSGVLKAGRHMKYTVYLWLDEKADNGAMNKVFLTSLEVKGSQVTNASMSNTIIYREGSSVDDKNGLLTRYADGKIEVVGTAFYGSTGSASSHPEINNMMFLAEKAGYDLSAQDLSTYAKMRNFIKTLDNDDKINQLISEQDNEIIHKYGLEEAMKNYEYLEDYLDVLKVENPTLAQKIDYDYALIWGYNSRIFDYAAAITFDDHIETLGIQGTGLQVNELVLPAQLKDLQQIGGISGFNSLTLPDGLESIGVGFLTNGSIIIKVDELTIPASVKSVSGYAFKWSEIKTIRIMGSTDGWDTNWNQGFTGTVVPVQ